MFLLSAKQGYIKAQYNLGMLYLFGAGCEKSTHQAMYWLTLAAKQGSKEAQDTLGMSILSGDIPGRSRSDGLILIQQSATNGHYVAQFRLAQELSSSNIPQALYWYKKAALLNFSPAQFKLSTMLFDSNKDFPTAMYWLRKAAARNENDAIKLLKEKEAEITIKCGACLKDLNGKGKKCVKCKSFITVTRIVKSRIGVQVTRRS